MSTPTISFPWLNGGEPVPLEDIPMAGDDEIDRLTEKYAKALVLQRLSHLLSRLLHLIAVRKAVDLGNMEKAQQIFKLALPILEPPKTHHEFDWPIASFREEYLAYFTREVEDRYQVKGADGANEFLSKKAKELEAEASEHTSADVKKYQKERFLIDLHWRLKRRVKTIDLEGEQVPFTRENLRQVLRWPSDYGVFAAAFIEQDTPQDRNELLSELTVDDLKKNSERSK